MSDYEEYDFEVIIDMLVLIALIGAVVWGVLLFQQHATIDDYKTVCRANPELRYGENCTTLEDCVNRCADRMAATAKQQLQQS